jgi:hypothetical protein
MSRAARILPPHDRIVFQKDLGSTTPAAAAAMTKFNPDKSWEAVEDQRNS